MSSFPNVREYARKSRLKPRVSIRILEKVLLNQAEGPLPEKRLVVAVICQALVDVRGLDRDHRRSALEFLLGHDLDIWASLVDLHPAYVRELAQKSGYLVESDHFVVLRRSPVPSIEQGGSDAGF